MSTPHHHTDFIGIVAHRAISRGRTWAGTVSEVVGPRHAQFLMAKNAPQDRELSETLCQAPYPPHLRGAFVGAVDHLTAWRSVVMEHVLPSMHVCLICSSSVCQTAGASGSASRSCGLRDDARVVNCTNHLGSHRLQIWEILLQLLVVVVIPSYASRHGYDPDPARPTPSAWPLPSTRHQAQPTACNSHHLTKLTIKVLEMKLPGGRDEGLSWPEQRLNNLGDYHPNFMFTL
jgi:hypothetical protein